MSDFYTKILGYLDYIKRKPKESKFFYFDKGRSFIVDGNKLKLLPLAYAKHYQKNEFYVHVDTDKKQIMYYSYDVSDMIADTHTNGEEGFFDWEQVESCVYNFLTLHMKELTDASLPYTDIAKGTSEPSTSFSGSNSSSSNGNGKNFSNGYQGYSNHGHGYHNTNHNSNNYSGNNYNSNYYPKYGTEDYKEREAFNEKLTALLKDNKTSNAIDHIQTSLEKMFKNKKFQNVDSILRLMSIEKFNLPIMMTILDVTRGADHVLKERKDFYNKVKTQLTKIKITPARADRILRDMEPGKEYKGVEKYES